MRLKFIIIPAALIFQFAEAQNGSTSLTASQGTVTSTSPGSSTTATTTASTPSITLSGSTQASLLEYKSVYEAPTIEEELQMATERFNLTKSQQDVWMTAAVDRRETEKLVRTKLDSKATDYDKEGLYRGLRTSQNTFYNTVIGYLNPAQKQAVETDRMILEEKRKKLAKLPPPAPTVTVAPVDSSAIKEAEKAKSPGKKPKKKKKTVGA